jgi:sulfur-oxidizing protein SoxX
MIRTLAVIILAALAIPLSGQAEGDDAAERIEKGRELAFARPKGNCLACHVIEGGELAGNYGPPLLMMKQRYPDREVLRARIWDATAMAPTTRMPPFGRHRILTEEEIDLVVDYVLTL